MTGAAASKYRMQIAWRSTTPGADADCRDKVGD